MTLCSLCQGINVHELVNEFKKPLERFEGYTHQPSFAALLESSKTCELCRLFREAIGSSNNFNTEFDSIPQQITIKNSPDYIRIQASPPSGKLYWDSADAAISNLQISSITVKVGQRPLGIGFLEVAAEKGSPAATSGNISGELIDSGAISGAVFNCMLSWIKACKETHKDCSPLRDTGQNAGAHGDEIFPLPTRVLDIGLTESSPIRLFVTNGVPAPYVALSHRWGSSDTVERTTLDTLEERIKDIPFGTLSCLFQDAVTVARKIGVRYLWIDSLCIIQDWERESAVMGQVYEYAEATISAVKSEDGASGFLSLDEQHIVPVLYRLMRNHDVSGMIYFRLPVNRIFRGPFLHAEPAWVGVTRAGSLPQTAQFHQNPSLLGMQGKGSRTRRSAAFGRSCITPQEPQFSHYDARVKRSSKEP